MSNKNCFHCDLPIYTDTKWYAVIEGINQPMCCPGCKAVAEVINAGGLTSYYRNRTQKVDTATNLNAKLVSELELYDRSDIQKTFVTSNHSSNSQQLTANLLIQGITCASCIWLLENHLQAIPGISQVYINLSSHKAQITWHTNKIKLSKIMQAIYSIGYKCKPWENDHKYNTYQQQKRSLISKLAVATIATMQVMMYAIATYFGDASRDLSLKF